LQVGHQSAWISTRIGLPDAWAALNASAENGTAVLAQAETTGAATAKTPAKAPAITAPFKNLRVIIVSSVVGARQPHSVAAAFGP
jgi:hypothetical protein